MLVLVGGLFRGVGVSSSSSPDGCSSSDLLFRDLVRTTSRDGGAAIVDCLTFGGNIIETGTDSYRLATTRARAEQQLATS